MRQSSPQALSIDLGADADGWRLARGWSDPERSADGRQGWVWAVGHEARLEIEIADPRYSRLVLVGSPMSAPAMPDQSMRLELNGNSLGERSLAAGQQRYEFKIPDGVLVAGSNSLGFRFRHVASPAELNASNDDHRYLAAQFSRLEFEAAPAVATAAPDTSSRPSAPQADAREAAPPRTLPVELRGETRPALWEESAWRRRFAVRDGDFLDFAVAAICAEGSRCGGGLVFRVDLLGMTGRRRLYRRAVEGPDEKGRWLESRVNLSEFEGREIELEFSVRRPPGTGDGLHPLWSSPSQVSRRRRRGDLSVVLVSVDTLRADHLGAYGGKRPTSPNLDRLAREGVLFERVISQAPWTTPSHMSMLTSMYPSQHGVNEGFGELTDYFRGKKGYPVLGDGATTLAEVLRDRGYMTLALTGGGPVSGQLGFHQGFQVFDEHLHRLEDDVAPRVEGWLDAYRETPFFLFLHTYEVHAPYGHDEFAAPLLRKAKRKALETFLSAGRAPTPNDERNFLREHGLLRREVTEAMYDSAIRFADAFLGRLFARLDELGLAENTLVVVTSDHGEEFGEHDSDRFYDAHCSTGYDELLHVPLIVRAPGLPRNRRVGSLAQTIDLAPTILDLLGIEAPAAMQGTSRKSAILGPPGRPGADLALSEATCTGPEIKALEVGGTKYLAAFSVDDGARTGVGRRLLWEKLFDLESDPGEKHDFAEVRTRMRLAMRFRMESTFWAMTRQNEGARQFEPRGDLLERLRALGYL